jgi:uncharacterized protein YndB with AHSA1/START domain
MPETMTAPKVRQQMLIRAPAKEVFRAMTDPAVTRRFWFSRGSGPLAPGARVRWDWEMYGGSAEVTVVDFQPDRRLTYDWSGGGGTRVDCRLEPREDGTMVTIDITGFAGPDACDLAIDSSGGFAFVLAAMKAWLEHGIELNVVPDKAPEAHVPGWRPSLP